MSSWYGGNMIIGVTGLFASGKDTVADYLTSKGFDHFSLSAILREEAQKRGIQINRNNLIKLGTDLKQEEGHEVLAKRALERIKKDTVISSIRHPKEVLYFKQHSDFKLIEVFADPKIRYERMLKRARENDSKMSFDEFIKSEKIERSSGGGQEFDAVFKLTDTRLDNNKDLHYLYQQIDKIISNLKN